MVAYHALQDILCILPVYESKITGDRYTYRTLQLACMGDYITSRSIFIGDVVS